jgi:YidC/Oxa1 family membrane protein insertase
MQPKNSLGNILFFFVLSGLVLLGAWRLQNWLYPPRVLLPPEAKSTSDLSARAAADALAPAVPGLGAAAQLAVQARVAEYVAEHNYHLPPLKPEPKPQPKEEPKVAKAPPPKAAPPSQVVSQAKPTDVRIGGDGFKIEAGLTSLGAGVYRLILTQFKAADSMGRPEDASLQLVPEASNRLDPSNLLFHYEKPDDDRPVNTLGTLIWKVDSVRNGAKDSVHEVVFSADVPGQDLRIQKIYTLKQDEYHIGLKVAIQRKTPGPEPVKFRYQLTSSHGLPIEGEWYTSIFRNALIGLEGQGNNFWRDLQDSRSIGIKSGGNDIRKSDKDYIRFAGVAVQYFASLVVVDDEQPKQDFIERVRPTVEGDPNPSKPQLDDITMRVMTQTLEVQEPVVHKYLLYYGPVKVKLLGDASAGAQGVPSEVVNRYVDKLHLDKLTDYGKFGWWTDIIIFFTNIMHGLMGWLHNTFRLNYGVCIILLTILVRAAMHPISRRQARTSMQMQALAPELKKLQEKYKNDPMERNRAQMELYRKHGVHPLGSCWIVFLQMPIFLGLYYSLQESIHFRLASFLWIKNLAAPDMLIWWSEKIPWISRPEDQGSFFYLGPYFNLLPVLAVALMVVQQKYLTPPPTDETQEMQFKMMKYMMIFMGLLFYKVAAGLCVYFIVSSAWGVAERKLLPKAKPATAPPIPPAGGGPGKKGGGGPGKKGGGPQGRGPKNGQSDGPFKKVQDMWAELLKQAKKK